MPNLISLTGASMYSVIGYFILGALISSIVDLVKHSGIDIRWVSLTPSRSS